MKRLTRNQDEAMIAGVAAGVADYYAIDPALVRLGFVLAALAHGLGLLVYVLCWIIVPPRESTAAIGETAAAAPAASEAAPSGETPRVTAAVRDARDSSGRGVLGAALIAGGLFLLMRQFEWFWLPPWATLRSLWPLILVAIGVGFVLDSLRRKHR